MFTHINLYDWTGNWTGYTRAERVSLNWLYWDRECVIGLVILGEKGCH